MEKVDTKKIVLGGILLIIIVLGIFIYMNYLRTFTVTFEVRLGPGIETQQVKINDTVKDLMIHHMTDMNLWVGMLMILNITLMNP